MIPESRSRISHRWLRASVRYQPIDNLPSAYRVLPYAIDLKLNGFTNCDVYNLRTFAPYPIVCVKWFEEFRDRVTTAIGQSYLPVCRLADGEFLFMLGFQPPTLRYGWRYPFLFVQWLMAKYRPRKRLRAGGTHQTKPLYASGTYSSTELVQIKRTYGKILQQVAQRGVIAADLSFCAVPFQDHFFPALRRWFNDHRISLTERNYVPFYFVYALLTGPDRHHVLCGRRVLVIHSATGPKQDAIKSSLIREGAKEVLWHAISTSRSLYDVIPVEQFVGAVDLCVFGAGIGKPAILAQLEPLGVPCIDAGYVMEVWADPSVAQSRIFTQPDAFDAAACGTATQ